MHGVFRRPAGHGVVADDAVVERVGDKEAIVSHPQALRPAGEDGRGPAEAWPVAEGVVVDGRRNLRALAQDVDAKNARSRLAVGKRGLPDEHAGQIVSEEEIALRVEGNWTAEADRVAPQTVAARGVEPAGVGHGGSEVRLSQHQIGFDRDAAGAAHRGCRVPQNAMVAGVSEPEVAFGIERQRDGLDSRGRRTRADRGGRGCGWRVETALVGACAAQVGLADDEVGGQRLLGGLLEWFREAENAVVAGVSHEQVPLPVDGNRRGGVKRARQPRGVGLPSLVMSTGAVEWKSLFSDHAVRWRSAGQSGRVAPGQHPVVAGVSHIEDRRIGGHIHGNAAGPEKTAPIWQVGCVGRGRGQCSKAPRQFRLAVHPGRKRIRHNLCGEARRQQESPKPYRRRRPAFHGAPDPPPDFTSTLSRISRISPVTSGPSGP